ncbi:fungal-specific transcription factor domain-containing protein, partial [Cyathus striatus]
WEHKILEIPSSQYTFPPQKLMDELVEAYFEHVNLVMPLLHRPTFDRSVAEGLHLRDDGFGGVVLLVCAVGSRYIKFIDERVLLDGIDSPFSAGYKWFNQVNVVKNKLLTLPNLYDIQIYALACQFFQGTSMPHSSWTMAGIGIRVAQDMGIHRRRVPLHQLTAEHELCKRAFWVLVSLDRMSSISLGRACAIDKRDMDLDMPVECDDEYWENEDPKKRFRQPSGKPTIISAFIYQLRLNRIMGFAMRSLYHVKSKMWDYLLEGWQKIIVEEMDSALNKWLADVPEFILTYINSRWDPYRSDDKFYRASLMLMGWYYYAQILIHRPFILSRDQVSHPFPSYTICTNAARACSNLVDGYRKRGYPIHMHLTLFAFTSGIVLSLNRRGKSSNIDTMGVDDIYKCLDLLKVGEER